MKNNISNTLSEKTNFILFFFLSVIIANSTSCKEAREIDCNEFDTSNIMLDYILFDETINSVQFSNNSETFIFSQNSLIFSEPYIERCGTYPDVTCDCVSVFESTYRATDIYLKNDIQIRLIEEDNINTVDINYQSNGFRWTSPQIPNNEASIISFFESITEDEITIDGQLYNDVIILENLNEDNTETQRLILKVGEGLIRFDYNNMAFERIQN